ncbi:hypothetical protein LCGC14_0384830 [marine sediment metagenome]|uniref:DNA methylase N-4/N-6 domain-containing protein n=1 Tax=marine sediment metagenome TaxID=412755 RepID=A0A0F9VNC2_9ZZZZ
MTLPSPYYQDEWVTIYHGDCREILPELPKVDLVLTDPPYGLTQNKQDVVVDLSPFLIYPAVVFSQQPYTTDLISQHRGIFKYDLVWDKILISGFLNANRMPLRQHEIILVFGNVNFTPIKSEGVSKNHSKGVPKEDRHQNYGQHNFADNSDVLGNMKHPTSILKFIKPHPSVAQHRTEKPTKLMEWLIKSYSVEGNLILDPFLGSGTTAYCAKKLNRKCIGIEIEEKYCEIAAKRCSQSVMNFSQ